MNSYDKPHSSNGAQPDEIIRFEDVDVTFLSGDQRFDALSSVNLSIGDGTCTTLIGPSGCGKTTLLRMVAGLVLPTRGSVRFRGETIEGLNNRVGFVTQDSNLFPWLTLFQNVEFPLVVRGVPKQERQRRCDEWIATVGLDGFEDYYPDQLSGGMQKRVSIIRSLVYEPDVVIMDEPFGPLDAQTRMILQQEMLDLWQRAGMTTIFVTHDLHEAVALGDRVVLMASRPGRIKATHTINLPHPRNIMEVHKNPEFNQLYDRVWKDFKEDVIDADERQLGKKEGSA